jgi:hypothetical protein
MISSDFAQAEQEIIWPQILCKIQGSAHGLLTALGEFSQSELPSTVILVDDRCPDRAVSARLQSSSCGGTSSVSDTCVGLICSSI